MIQGSLPPAIEPTRHKPAHIRDCLAELNVEIEKIAAYRGELKTHIDELERQIRSHLWVTDDFLEPARRSLSATMGQIEALEKRLQAVADGYGNLPQEKKPAVKG